MIETWMCGTVLDWFKQKQELSESRRFFPRANCKMREAERIIERYVTNPTTIQVMDETMLYFRVLSMSKEDTWYNVYFQCSFCDCLDYASKCKHLMGIRLLIEHMPKLQKELHFIDDALEMRGVGNLVDDATIDIDGDKDESIDTTISNLAETLRTFQKSVHSITNPSVSICKA